MIDEIVDLALYFGYLGTLLLFGLVVVGDEGVGLLVDQLSGGGLGFGGRSLRVVHC